MSTTALCVIAGSLAIVLGASWATLRFGSWRLLALGGLGAVACSALALWLYSRRPVPAEQPCALPTSIAELGTVCGFRNPEDLQHVPSLGLILITEEGFGGRLLSLRSDD